jgi:hypothetical protein
MPHWPLRPALVIALLSAGTPVSAQTSYDLERRIGDLEEALERIEGELNDRALPRPFVGLCQQSYRYTPQTSLLT